MKLKTSYSELTVFKKDLTRFWPLWAMYLAGGLLTLMEFFGHDSYDYTARHQMAQLIPVFGIVNLLYAGCCAVFFYGDLYNTRMCYSIHTTPIRRETLFASHWGAALVCSLAPNLVLFLPIASALDGYWFLALYWLLASTLEFLFFFGLASVSAMLTGNRFAMLLVYGGFNFISLLAYYVLNAIYLPEMWGVFMNPVPFFVLCPVVYLFASDCRFFAFTDLHSGSDVFYRYDGLSTGWGYLAALGVLGILFALIAVWLYRKRHLESAGDFLAFARLKLPSCAIITACVTAVFALFESLTGSNQLIWCAFGLTVGFFGSLMLLERRVKVFRTGTLVGFVLMAVLLAGSLFAVKQDLFHVVRWVPEADRVESVTLANGSPYIGIDGDYGLPDEFQAVLTEPDDIQHIVDAHRQILTRLDPPFSTGGEWAADITLAYKMKDGRTVYRCYDVMKQDPCWDTFQEYLYTPENIFGYTDWESYIASVKNIEIHGAQLPKPLHRALLEALQQDVLDGHAGYYNGELTLMHVNIYTSRYQTIPVSEQASHTLALLNTPPYLMGYSDWDTFLRSAHHLEFNGESIPEKFHMAFLEALQKDCQAGHGYWPHTDKGVYSVVGTTYIGYEEYTFYLQLDSEAVNVLTVMGQIHEGDWKAEGY